MDLDEVDVFWEIDELEVLVRTKLVPRGETTKCDLKAALDLSTDQGKADLLKDISAMANTVDHANRNHGFIVLGASANKLTFTEFAQDADHLQATVDDLVKHYVEPFVPSRVYMFGGAKDQWGVIVIPPTRSAPHVVVKDIHKRYRGDIYVRRGTVTDKAMPGDFVRFFGQRLDEHAYQLRVEMRELQQRIVALESGPRQRQARAKGKQAPAPLIPAQPVTASDPDLLHSIEEKLGAARDPIVEGLTNAARDVDTYLRSSDIPWALQVPTKEEGEKLLQAVEDKARPYWRALARIIHLDDAGKYDDAVIDSLSLIAREYSPQPGLAFNSGGQGFRHYPLVVALYVAFVVGAGRLRSKLLRRIGGIPLAGRDDYDDPERLADVLFYLRRADEVFQTQHPQYPQSKWCDGVSARIKGLIDAITDPGDPRWRQEPAFFVGEFLLSLMPMDAGATEEWREHPCAGAFMYYSNARPAITRFLKGNVKAVEAMYSRPLREILATFDENARRLVSATCFGDGFTRGALAAAYPQEANAPGQ